MGATVGVTSGFLVVLLSEKLRWFRVGGSGRVRSPTAFGGASSPCLPWQFLQLWEAPCLPCCSWAWPDPLRPQSWPSPGLPTFTDSWSLSTSRRVGLQPGGPAPPPGWAESFRWRCWRPLITWTRPACPKRTMFCSLLRCPLSAFSPLEWGKWEREERTVFLWARPEDVLPP